MRNIRKISMIGATFLLAAATGHVMQNVGPSPALNAGLVAPSMRLEEWNKRVEAKQAAKAMRVQLIVKTVLTNPPAPKIARDLGVGPIPATHDDSGDHFMVPLSPRRG